MSKEKKIFFPKIHPEDFCLYKRWFIEYYIYTHKGLHSIKKIVAGKLNKLPTVEDRLACANTMIDSILNEHYNTTDKPKEICPLLQALESLNIRPRSRATYTSKIIMLKKWLKDKPINALSIIDANAFIKYLFDNKSPTTVNNYRMVFSYLFDVAVRAGYLSSNPFAEIKKIKSYPTSKTPFSARQKAYLKEKIIEKNPQLWLCVQLLYYCFIRPKEQRFLKIGDIDFDNYKICIRGEISKNCKTEFVNIPVPFRCEIDKLKNYSLDSYVITKNGVPGATVTAVNYINNQHAPFLQNSFFGLNYSFYSWKHTGAIAAVQNGVNVKELQLQLRHHSLDQVNEYLKNMGLSECDGIINKFPKI